MKSVFLFLLLFPFSAMAILPGPVSNSKTGIGRFQATAVSTDDYRLGDEWGKHPVTPEVLAASAPTFRRAALATAHVGGATGFFLGKFRGELVMATNHHVFPAASACVGSGLSFPLLGIQARCDKFLGTWPEVDLALFTIKLVNPADSARLEEVAGNFQFQEDVRAGENLLTIGFGIAGNGNHVLMANQDSDCYVFSQAGEYRLMGDPDQWNPGTYQAWSFALGCDVSHGDSGSAIVDRDSGRIVGIIWTGRIPKSPAVQSSRNLDEIFKARNNDVIWSELSYAVPARKMGEFLQGQLKKAIPDDTKQILQALLQ